MFDLYLITDPDAPGGVVEVTRRAIAAAPPERVAVQLRAKDRPRQARLELARALRDVTAERGVALLVNGEPDVALAASADGVHLPEGAGTAEDVRAVLGRGAIVGTSCHDRTGVLRAGATGSTFVTLGPYAPTPGKGPPLDRATFAAIAAESTVPILALGGIEAANAPSALAAGAAGLAVVRAVYRAADPARAVAELLALLDTPRASGR